MVLGISVFKQRGDVQFREFYNLVSTYSFFRIITLISINYIQDEKCISRNLSSFVLQNLFFFCNLVLSPILGEYCKVHFQ